MAASTSSSKPVSTIGVMDIGSSAIRMVIAEVRPDGGLRILENLSRGVLLGRDGFTTGHLSNESIRAACEAIRRFKQVLDSYGVKRSRAVATSAVRESINADTFVDRVLIATGVEVEIIEGQEEARLKYDAVRHAVQEVPELQNGDALFVEVGGGSTEISLMRHWEPLYAETYALGSIRINQEVATVSGDHQTRLRMIRQIVSNRLANIGRDIPLAEADHFIALGGDVRFAAGQLAGEAKGAVQVVSREAFIDFCDKVCQYDVERLVDRFRLSHTDAETIVPALVAYRELLRQTKAPAVFVPPVSMRDGLLLSLARMETGQGAREFAGEIAASAATLGRRYHFDEAHARHVARLALSLFDQLTPEHGLGAHHRMLLEVAALLHDIGLFVSPQAHHKHSQYLIAASNLFGLCREDIRIAANVARYHRRSPPKPVHVEYASLDRTSRMVVVKLAAILRLANALDKDHVQKINDIRLVREEDRWVLLADTQADLTSERLALGRVTDLFEDTFGRPIVLQLRPRP